MEPTSGISGPIKPWPACQIKKKSLNFGVVQPRSNHEYYLRNWLQYSPLKIGEGIHLVYNAPHHMVKKLRTGELDGYCCGEPWNQRATLSKVGAIIDFDSRYYSADLDKVLAVRTSWHNSQPGIHRKLIQACTLAAKWTSDPKNADKASAIISHRKYVNTKQDIVRASLLGEVFAGFGRMYFKKNFLMLFDKTIFKPSPQKLRWYITQMVGHGHLTIDKVQSLDLNKICLSDFYLDSIPESLFHFEERESKNNPVKIAF